MSDPQVVKTKEMGLAVLAPKSIREIEEAIAQRYGERPRENMVFMATLDLIKEGRVNQGTLRDTVRKRPGKLLPEIKKEMVFSIAD